MISLFRTLSLRYFLKRRFRTLLVILSIALGVATLVATNLLNRSMKIATDHAANPLGNAAQLLVSNGEAGVQRELAQELQNVPGVRRAEPLIVERVLLPDLGNRRALLIGGQQRDDALNDNPYDIKFTLIANPAAFGKGAKPVFVGKQLAGDLPANTRAINVQAAGRIQRLEIVGTVEAEGAAAALGQTVLVMEIRQAAALLDRPDLVKRIDLFLDPSADRDRVKQEIETKLGGRAEVFFPENHARGIHDVMSGLHVGLLISGCGALLVGLFLVYNALSVTVAERRHEIGILRSIGATRVQIALLFVGEAALLGIIGAAIGIPLGKGLAWFSLGAVQRVVSEVFLEVQAHHVDITWNIATAAVASGIGIAILAAIGPALKAAFDQPADAVRRAPPGGGVRVRLLFLAGSSLVLLSGLAAISLRAYLPPRWGVFGGMVLMFLGMLLCTPPLTYLLAYVLHPWSRRFFGIEARLASDNLVRTPGRTGLVVAALAAAVALMVQTAGAIRSNEEPILQWVDDAITADLFITCGGPASAGNQNVPQEEAVAKQLEELPGVGTVLPLRFRRCSFRSATVLIIAVDTQKYYEQSRRRLGDASVAAYTRLKEPNDVLVSENFLAVHKVKVGDRIEVRGPNGPVPMDIVGSVIDYSWNRGAIIMNVAAYQQEFDDRLYDMFEIYIDPQHDAQQTRQTVNDWCSRQGLMAVTRDDLRRDISAVLDRLYGVSRAQQFLAGFVAALGVLMALLISVIQRQRELGLLRAVGATQWQVLRSVLAEATLMGVMGALLGVLIGIPLEWFTVRLVLLEEAGLSFPMLFPWWEAGGIALLTTVIATLAGLIPALHAVRLPIAETIAYE